MSDITPLDPAPEEWLTAERKERLQLALGSSIPLLTSAGVLPAVLTFWIRQELGATEDNPTAPMAWASSQWGHRLDSLYLQKKDRLDQASCRLLRVQQQGLALELYHRLLAKEASFEQLSQQYGVGPERFNGGLLEQQPLAKFAGNLGSLLRKLKPGEITKPLQMGKLFGVLQLESFVPAVHGEESSQLLLQQELQQWVAAMAEHLAALVSSAD